jgi:hypothetical protein
VLDGSPQMLVRLSCPLEAPSICVLSNIRISFSLSLVTAVQTEGLKF